ncbi:DNA repair and recombination protein RAD54B [Aplysia californica]|uniref:DNA repair and recombination protein RAD54B n=1 Tax=Aplysia californica TaxID=6500 RepID=A0ABM1A9T6_APLCA|nr:DNA repair and recombination protein RAD54B [Aplysia californica]
MRRSAAPSKTGKDAPFKRMKFTPPALVTGKQPLSSNTFNSITNNKVVTTVTTVSSVRQNHELQPTSSPRAPPHPKEYPFRPEVQSTLSPKLFSNVVSGTPHQMRPVSFAGEAKPKPTSPVMPSPMMLTVTVAETEVPGDQDKTSGFNTFQRNGQESNANPLVKNYVQQDKQHLRPENESSGCESGVSSEARTLHRQNIQRPVYNKIRPSENESPYKQVHSGNRPKYEQGQTEKKTASKYLSVVWCKMSKKKHKKWEGDAVLVTHGRTASLYDMEGKVIAKGSGYKSAELDSLKEDETLFVGGKEIQVLSELTEEQFKSGKCFSAGSCSAEAVVSSVKKNLPAAKPFANPLLKNGAAKSCRNPVAEKAAVCVSRFDPTAPGAVVMLRPGSDHQVGCSGTFSISVSAAAKPFANPLLKNGAAKSCRNPVAEKAAVCVSRFDPTAPGAVVMLRPGSDHQWRNNKLGQPVTDVVVDPYISSFLRAHQREGVAFLYECVMGFRDFHGQGAVLADDMGLGKTLQCIALIWTLLKQGPYGGKPVAKKVIVITPGSLVKNWFLEFKKWLGTERLNVYAVSSDKKVQDFIKSSNHQVLVISYEMFVRNYEDVKQVPFDLIICDEGHRLKNTAIKTTSLIMSLPSRKRIVLTGTPVQNDLQEFYSIVEFCNPGILGTSAAFRRVYEEPIVASRQPEATGEQKELGTDRAQELTRLTQMFVLRRTQEVNNDYLPPKVELVLFCRPSALQLTLYRQLIRSNLIRRCLSGNLSGSPHLICIGALKQLCNHPGLMYRKAAEAEMKRRGRAEEPGYGEERHNVTEDSIYDGLLRYFPDTFDASTVSCADSGKLEVLSQILSSVWKHSSSEKVVLVSNHTKTLDFLQVFCDFEGYTYLRLDGQTPTAQRQDLVNRFNNKFSPQRIFLLSSKAGGVGLNLIGASRLILYDIDWNPANDLQAMARVWRDGQTRKVHIYRLLTVGTIEEKIYQRQVTKQGLSETVMELCGKNNNVMFSLEDLKDLFSLNEKTDCETHSMLSCGCGGDPSYERAEVRPEEGQGEDRACQLTNNAVSLQKNPSNLTMAELLHWSHWRGDFVRDGKSWYLDETGSTVSFVFWHEINNAS